MSTIVLEEPVPGVAVVTLNRPATLNSLTLEVVTKLDSVLTSLAGDTRTHVVVITGAGRGFCSGHDLADLQQGASDEGSAEATMQEQEAFAGLTTRIRTMPQPVIAAVNGPAAGGGLAIALAADTRLCSESARFNAAFVRIGLSGCDMGVSYLLPKIVGTTLAFEMMLTGRLVDAAEALASRLVLRVVPDGEVLNAALELARDMTRNAPFALRMTKEVMWANLDATSLQQAIALENRTQVLCTQTESMREAISAFIDKRAPSFAPQ